MDLLAKIPIIQRKITVPLLKNVMERKRLDRFLDRALDPTAAVKLVPVVATAGYGKTVMLAEYATRSPRRFCWYSLDDGDREPVIFLSYLVESLRRACPDLGPDTLNRLDLVNVSRGNYRSVIRELCSEFELLLQEDVVLVLDDFHHVEKQEEVLDCLHQLLVLSPDRLRLVIASRHDLPFSIARLEMEGRVCRLGAAELTLTRPEFDTLLQTNGSFPYNIIEKLYHLSKGWIAAVVLLSRAGAAGGEEVILLSPGKNSRGKFFKYIAQEIYDAFPEELRVLARRSGVVEVFDPSLLVVLVGGDASGTPAGDNEAAPGLLVELERRLLLERDGEGSYRYHPLIREFLLERLDMEEGSEAAAALHRQAAGVLEEAGRRRESIEHYLQGRLVGDAVRLGRELVTEQLAQGMYQAAADLLTSLPESLVGADPKLSRMRGKIPELKGQHELAFHWYQRAKNLAKEQKDLEEHANVCFALGDFYSARLETGRAIAEFEEGLRLVGPERNAFTMWIMGECLFSSKDLHGAIGWHRRSREAARQSGDLSTEAEALFSLGVLLSVFGRIREAGSILTECKEVRKRLLARPHEVTFPHLLLTFIKLYNGSADLPRLLIECREALRLSREYPHRRLESWNLLALAYVEARLGDHDSALRDVLASIDLMHEIHEYLVLPRAMDLRGEVLLAQGDFPSAFEAYQESIRFQRETEFVFWLGNSILGFADTLFRMGDRDKCLEMLEEAEKIGQEYEGDNIRACAGYLLARLDFATGDHAPALQRLRLCLELTRTAYCTGGVASLAAGDAAFLSWMFNQLVDNDGTSEELATLVNIARCLGDHEYDKFLALVASTHRDPGLSRVKQVLGEDLSQFSRTGSAETVIASPGPVKTTARRYPPVRVFLLGPFEIQVGSRRITAGQWSGRQSRALILYLLLHPGRLIPREELLRALRPNSEQELAEKSFYRALRDLRTRLYPEYTPGDRLQFVLPVEGCYYLDPQLPLWVDLDEFKRGLAAVDHLDQKVSKMETIKCLEEVVALYRSDLVVDLGGIPTWLSVEREHLRTLYLQSLERLMLLYMETGAYERGINCGELLARVDPCNEEPQRNLIELWHRLGQPTKALRQFHVLRRMLSKQLGILPSPVTTALYEKIHKTL